MDLPGISQRFWSEMEVGQIRLDCIVPSLGSKHRGSVFKQKQVPIGQFDYVFPVRQEVPLGCVDLRQDRMQVPESIVTDEGPGNKVVECEIIRIDGLS